MSLPACIQRRPTRLIAALLIGACMAWMTAPAQAQTPSFGKASANVPAAQLGQLYDAVPAIALQRNAVLAVQQQFRNGERAAAMQAADRHIATHPNDVQMRFLKTVMQSEMGQTQAALDGLTELTQTYPELPEPHNNLAVLLSQGQQWEAAREALQTAVRLQPDYRVAWQNLGAVNAHLAAQARSQAQSQPPAASVSAAPR